MVSQQWDTQTVWFMIAEGLFHSLIVVLIYELYARKISFGIGWLCNKPQHKLSGHNYINLVQFKIFIFSIWSFINFCRPKRKLRCFCKSWRNTNYLSYLHLDMTQSCWHLSSFRLIRRLVIETKTIVRLVFVESSEELSRICIFIGSSMRLCKFVAITSPRRRSRRWQQCLQGSVVVLWLIYIMWKQSSCFVVETTGNRKTWYLWTPLRRGRYVDLILSFSKKSAWLVVYRLW